MYCKQCGKEIDDDSLYCSICGTKQSDREKLIENQSTILNPNPATQNINLSVSLGRTRKPKTANSIIVTEKYDNSYEGEKFAAFVGISLLIITLILYFILRFNNDINTETFKAIAAFINFIYRILVTMWVVEIAKSQNRSPVGWGFFAFFIPNFALIIIGFSRKLLMESTNSSISDFPNRLNQEKYSND